MEYIYYICRMNNDSDIRTVFRTPEFDEYYNAQQIKVQEKYDYVLELLVTQYVISEKFVKKLDGSNLYEVRISVGYNEHRTLLFAIDKESFIESTQAILLNSFLKKDTKQYRKEIIKAEKILKRYLK